SGGFMLASAGDTRLDAGILFSPRQTYPTQLQPAPVPAAFAPAVAAPAVKVETRLETKPAAPTRSIAAAAPQRKPAAKKKDSGELFNEAQLASIKTRLKLSDYQEQYWPPVE